MRPSIRGLLCPFCGAEVQANDMQRKISHAAPVCARFTEKMTGFGLAQVTVSAEVLPPVLELSSDAGGGIHAGYMRRDQPALFHTIVRGKPGSLLMIAHWRSRCLVCEDHGFTLADFEQQWPSALERFNQGHS